MKKNWLSLLQDIEDLREFGASIAQACKKKKISYPTYYVWRKRANKLSKKDAQAKA